MNGVTVEEFLSGSYDSQEVQKIEGRIRELYDPTTAFGNADLIRAIRDRQKRIQWEAEHAYDCKKCDGAGFIEISCEDCEGRGTTKR